MNYSRTFKTEKEKSRIQEQLRTYPVGFSSQSNQSIHACKTITKKETLSLSSFVIMEKRCLDHSHRTIQGTKKAYDTSLRPKI